MFNFLFRTKKDIANKNTLNEINKTPQDVVENFIKYAKDTTQNRESDFKILMDFVLESEQWTLAEKRKKDGEDDECLVFNFSQEYIERYMARLFPRNPQTGVLEVGVKVFEDNADKSLKYEKEILDVYHQNGLAKILLEQGVNYLCGGDGCFYYPRDPITKRAEIISIDPTKCYLGWGRGGLVQFAFMEYQADGEYKTTYYDKKTIIVHDGLKNEWTAETNKFGIIPFYWIPNFPKPHRHEGIPKTKLLADMDRVYNKNASNFDKRIEENTEPHMIIKSNAAKADKIERGRKKKTKIGVDDDIKYLELKEGHEILDWLKVIEKRIASKTGIVHSAGETKSNISGKSLSFQYSDMMDLIGFMRLTWDEAFREMNTAILTYKYGTNIYKTDPVYQPFLIQDNSDRIQQYADMIESNLISHKDAIDELRAVENAEQKLKEILEEKKLFQQYEPKEPKEPKEKNEKNNFNNNND